MIKDADDFAPVSVVLPCYCCSKTIERALASVAKQTRKPFEVILVDDASPDGSLEVLRKLEREYSGWVKLLILDANQGAASARNAGWAVASQPYIAFLDADDAWHPEKIEIQYSYMSTHSNVVLCGHGHRLLANEGVLPDWEVTPDKAHPVSKWDLILSNRFVTPSVMLKRDITQRFYEKQRFMEDHMLWMGIICGGAVVKKLDVQLAAIYKLPYGALGLSAQFWSMERGDLGNYRRLYQIKCITVLQLILLAGFSLLKYVRRLILYWGYFRWKK